MNDPSAKTDPVGPLIHDAAILHTPHLANVSAALAELKHPSQLGPYHIQAPIGEGGMGTVYRAEQREPINRIVALKVIKIGMDTGEVIARFESERQALALMNHGNVARVLDAGATETGRPYFVMEYVAGEPITGFCDRQKLTIRQRLELFIQACDAVQHAHQKGIIHRDLKPSNILVTQPEGGVPAIVKVIDFGLAKAMSQRLTEKTLLTETGRLVGTPEYMSPEQADIGFADIDTRSDVYSLGVVLYELLSGARPFHETDFRSSGIFEILRIIREVEPPRPSAVLRTLGDAAATTVARDRKTPLDLLRKQLRSELEWIPLKAMRKERSERYATATEVAEDIRNYLQSRPLRAGPASASYRARKFLRRNKGAVIAAASLLVALVAGAIGTGWQAVRATRAQQGLESALIEVRRQKSEVESSNAIALAANAGLRAINNFITEDLLQSADPSVARGEQLTMREALDIAGKNVGRKFKDQPLTEASIRQTLATTYDALGRADLGMPHAQQSLALRRQLLGNDDPLTVGSINTLTTLLESQAKLEDAEPLCREAVDRARPHVAAHPRLYITAVSNKGRLLNMQGRRSDAKTLALEALDVSNRVLGKDAPETLAAINNVASLLLLQQEFAEAALRFKGLVEAERRLVGEDDPDTLIAESNLARALQGKGDLDDAEALYRQTLATMQRVLGPTHPSTLQQIRHLGSLLQDRKKFADAEKLYRQVLATHRKELGEDHPETLTTMNHLASVLQSQGRIDDAISMNRDVLQHCRRRMGNDHPDTLVAINNLGDTLLKKNDYEGAEPLFAELYRRAPASQLAPPTAALCVTRWGPCLVKLGRYEPAIKPLEAARKALIDTEQQEHPVMRTVLGALVQAYAETGQPQKSSERRVELEKLMSNQ